MLASKARTGMTSRVSSSLSRPQQVAVRWRRSTSAMSGVQQRVPQTLRRKLLAAVEIRLCLREPDHAAAGALDPDEAQAAVPPPQQLAQLAELPFVVEAEENDFGAVPLDAALQVDRTVRRADDPSEAVRFDGVP